MSAPDSATPKSSHRVLSIALFIAVGTVAAGLGAWWAYAHRGAEPAVAKTPATPQASQSLPSTPTASAPTPSAQADALPADFWTQTFDTPDGKQLALASLKGHPIVLNFWASWCPPCVKEMPDINRFHQAFSPKGWKVVGLAVDGPTPVREFLAKVPVGFEIGLAGFGGTELSQALGNDAGGLPFTVLISADGRVLHRKTGGTTLAELSDWASAL